MKKYYLPVMLAVLMLLIMAGCQSEVMVEEDTESDTMTESDLEMEADEQDEPDDPVLMVAVSFFPYYDMVTHIGGKAVEVHQMVPDGADPHSYEPNPRNLIQLESSDLFIYNGAGFENWIEGAVSLLSGTDTLVMKAEDYVTLLTVSEEDDHGHSDDDDDHSDDDDHGPYDPHLWTDPVNMKDIARHVTDALIEIDPSNKEVFEINYGSYAASMDALDASLRQVSEEADKHELLISHSAFGYLAHRYGFEEIAITGVSPHTEPNPGRLAELTDLARSHEIEYIFFETLANPRTAEILALEAGLTPLMLYNAEGLTNEQRQNGVTYLTLMEENVKTLRKALVK